MPQGKTEALNLLRFYGLPFVYLMQSPYMKREILESKRAGKSDVHPT
jgi:hypothetical protein